VKQILTGQRVSENAKWKFKLAGVNTSRLPKEKRIGKFLVWVAKKIL
jgi:hypothetical protein